SGRVPRDGVRRGGVLGAEVGAVQQELDAGHAHVVGGGGSYRNRAGDGRAVRRRRDRHRRRRGVGRHGNGDRGGGRGIARQVPGHRRQGVGARRGGGGVPGDGVGRCRIFRAEAGPVEHELDAGHADVVRGGGGNRNRADYRGTVRGGGERRGRRRGVWHHGDGD